MKVTVNLEKATTRAPLFDPDFDKSITVTLPVSCVDEEYRDNLEAFAEKNGYYSISKKGDDKVKIEMREYSYKLLMTNIGMETVGGIGSAIDSGDYPFILSLEKYTDDFSEIYISVDKAKYEKAGKDAVDKLFSDIGLCGLHYLEYCQDSDGVCSVILFEEGTNLLVEQRDLTIDDII